MGDTTTIEISVETWQELNQRKENPSDTFDNVVRRLLHKQTDESNNH